MMCGWQAQPDKTQGNRLKMLLSTTEYTEHSEKRCFWSDCPDTKPDWTLSSRANFLFKNPPLLVILSGES